MKYKALNITFLCFFLFFLGKSQCQEVIKKERVLAKNKTIDNQKAQKRRKTIKKNFTHREGLTPP